MAESHHVYSSSCLIKYLVFITILFGNGYMRRNKYDTASVYSGSWPLQFIHCNESSNSLWLVGHSSQVVVLGPKRIHKYNHTRFSYSYNGIESFQLVRGFTRLKLILRSGDIERNPGLVKNPCSACHKAMAKNHRTLTCNSCNKHYHIKCGKVKPKDYKQMHEANDLNWKLCFE